MSDSMEPFEHEPTPGDPLLDELYALAAGYADDQLSREESQRLESLLVDHDELCDRFLDYMQMMSALENEPSRLREYLAQGADISDPSPSAVPSFDVKDAGVRVPSGSNGQDVPHHDSPVLGFLGNCFDSVCSFFSRPNVLTLLLAVGLPCVILVVLATQVARGPAPQHPVATISQTHECVWGEGSAPLSAGTELYPGERVRLAEGLSEITFAGGATVLLEGPVTFNVTNASRGFLHDGSLVAHVRSGDEGFTIQTPSMDVVDLGTEFGVCVEDEKGTAKVEVFQGEVELRATAEKGRKKTLRESLIAGHAVRVEVATRQGTLPVVREIPTTTNAFVRHMPAPIPAGPRTVLADFSGGDGNSRADQFPGVAGSGWATGWRVAGTEAMTWSTSIERADPVLGGGEYLRALALWKPGQSARLAEGEIERRLASNDGVDLDRPYVVSFNLRVDTLARFIEPGDRFSVCSRRPPRTEGKREGQGSSGWHVSAAGKDPKLGNTKNWVFCGGDSAGRYRPVDSGIPVQQGSTYSFRVLVDPPAARWTPSIAVDGGKWTEFESMGMRSSGTAEQNDYWPILYFYCRMRDGNKAEGPKNIGFSLDSLEIVPK